MKPGYEKNRKGKLVNLRNLPDELQYIWDEVKSILIIVEKLLENKVSKEEVMILQQHVEKITILPEIVASIRQLSDKVEELAEVRANLMLVASQLEQYAVKGEVHQAVSYLSNEVDKIKTYRAEVEVSSEELLDLNATPKLLVPAVGAGKYAELIRVELLLDYNTASYSAVSGKQLSVEYATSGPLLTVEAEGLLDQTSDQRRCYHHNPSHIVASNEAIVLTMVGGEVTLGDSPLRLAVNYRIIDVLI